jgi:hypothetical protein
VSEVSSIVLPVKGTAPPMPGAAAGPNACLAAGYRQFALDVCSIAPWYVVQVTRVDNAHRNLLVSDGL